MKKLIMTIAVVVVLMSISGEAVADVWSRSGLRSSRRFRFQPGGRRFLGGSFRIPYGNVWSRSGLSSRYGGYGGYGYGRGPSTLGRVLGYVGSGMNVLHGLNEISVTNRLVNNQISTTNRMVSMAEREQAFRLQNNTVLVQRGPIILQVLKPEQTPGQENEKLRQEIEALKLELEKSKLQQELEKAKK